MGALLEVAGLLKRYPGLTALDGVSLAIEEGEIFSLLGRNGAGKTTLIGVVAGLVKKTAGTVRLFGVDVDVDPIRPRAQLGLVPQEVNVDPFFTVREALRFQLGYYGRAPDEARIDEVLAALSLTAKGDARPMELSGGMKRRLLIAKALVHRPRLLFLDEPTAGVDVELRGELWAYVRRLRQEGTTVVLTTHYLDEAEQLADRVGIIDKGQLLVVEPTASLLKRLGERHLSVHLRSPAAALPPGVVATLSADGLQVRAVERPGGPPAAGVVSALLAAGLAIADMSLAPATLEDVLLKVLEGRGR